MKFEWELFGFDRMERIMGSNAFEIGIEIDGIRLLFSFCNRISELSEKIDMYDIPVIQTRIYLLEIC